MNGPYTKSFVCLLVRNMQKLTLLFVCFNIFICLVLFFKKVIGV